MSVTLFNMFMVLIRAVLIMLIFSNGIVYIIHPFSSVFFVLFWFFLFLCSVEITCEATVKDIIKIALAKRLQYRVKINSVHTFAGCIYGTNNCWFPLARKWPTWKWTWIWFPYGKIGKKCPRDFRRDSRGNPRDLNMCRTGRSAALSRGRKSMPPIGVLMKRESMKLVVRQRKFT